MWKWKSGLRSSKAKQDIPRGTVKVGASARIVTIYNLKLLHCYLRPFESGETFLE